MAEPAFLGPTGDHIQILWEDHAKKRLYMRYNPPGKVHGEPPADRLHESVEAQVARGWIPMGQIEARLRHPTDSDMASAEPGRPDCFLRIIRLNVGGTVFLGRAACKSLDPASDKNGRILILTVHTPTTIRRRRTR
jgi:hypothetical protein